MTDRFVSNENILWISRPGGRCKVIGKLVKKEQRINKGGNARTWFLFKPASVGGVFVDHMWIKGTKRTPGSKVCLGSVITFTGKVHTYYRGGQQKLGVKSPYSDMSIVPL